jgi:hypothetical protein
LIYRVKIKSTYAGVVELADTQDLGSCAYRCAGSSPVTRTKQQRVSILFCIDTLCSYIQQMNILYLIMYSFAINNKTVSQSKNFN